MRIESFVVLVSITREAALPPSVIVPVEVPPLIVVGLLIDGFKVIPPEPDLIVVVPVEAPSPMVIVLAPVPPAPISMAMMPVPPIVTVPADVPVLMFVAKLELAFKDAVAPVTVNPVSNVFPPVIV